MALEALNNSLNRERGDGPQMNQRDVVRSAGIANRDGIDTRPVAQRKHHMRKSLRETLAELLASSDRQLAADSLLQDEWLALGERLKKIEKTKKQTNELRVEKDRIETRRAEIQHTADETVKWWSQHIDRTKDIAKRIPPKPGPHRVAVWHHYMGAHRSAGPQYDIAIVRMKVEDLTQIGLVDAEAELSEKGYMTGRVFASVEDERLDSYIATHYSPPMTAKEEIRRYLKQGLNIRVFNPFLPHGIEQKLGLDYFGNDIETKS